MVDIDSMLVCAIWQKAKLAVLFQGRQSNDTSCYNCNTEVHQTEYFLDLKIPISGKSDLLSTMRANLKPMELKGVDQYECGVCERKVSS